MRPRLARRVDDALGVGSVIITAGPGSGKTTILDQAVADRAAAWLSCSDGERVPGALLMRLVAAIAEAAPGASDAFGEQLATGIDAVDAEAATGELIAELSRLLVDPLVVVIDDGEHLEGAGQSLRLIGDLITAGPSTLRVALASRRPLELRVAKARAAGDVTELTGTDLVFDAQDCESLLRARTGTDPAPREVDRVMEVTEGWPLGVALAAALAERGGLAALDQLGTASDLGAYLAEELLDSMESELRAAAIDLSVARVITPEVSAALGHPDDVGRRLEASGVLLRWVDGGGSFSYHPLVREFLLDRLREDVERLRRVHAAVAPAVAKSGEPVEAIDHWIRAKSWPDAVKAIGRHGMVLVRPSPQLVAGWLEALPDEARRLPAMLTLSGQIEWLSGDNSRAIPDLRAAVEAFREHPNPRLEWLARSILTDCLFTAGRVEEVEAAVAGWDRTPADAAGRLPALSALFAAVALAAYGRFDRSEELVERVRAGGRAGPAGPTEGLRRLFVDVPRGRLDEASQALRRGLTELKAADPAGHIHLRGALAMTTAERGYPEEALDLWEQVQREGSVAAPALSDAGHGWCALLHAQAERLAEAEAELAVYRGLEPGARSFIRGLAPATVAALRGDPDGTLSGADLAVEIVREGPTLFRSTVAAELTPALVAVERADRAAELIAGTLEAVDSTLPGEWGSYPRARLHGLRAWLAHLEGAEERADRDLNRLLSEDEARRYVIRREWPRLEPLIWSSLERGVLDPANTVEVLSACFPGGLELVALLDHPVAAVRRAALAPAVRSGDPDAVARLHRLESKDPELAESAADALERLSGSLPPLRFEVLGGFLVRRGSWVASDQDWARPIDARLVRFLLVHASQPVPEDMIFEALWPDRPVSSARRSLQVSVSRARGILDPPGAQQSTIEAGERAYRLALDDGASVDADKFQAAAAGALSSSDPDRRPLLERARSLWGGEPLPEERYSDWATAYRERLLDGYIAVLTALGDLHQRAGEQLEAAEVARELVDLDPLNEAGHRALMTAYARTGRRGHALRQYLECRRALVDSLGIEPAEATSQLQSRILAGETV